MYKKCIHEMEHGIHSSNLLNSRCHEQGDYNNVQAPSVTDFLQEITAMLKDE